MSKILTPEEVAMIRCRIERARGNPMRISVSLCESHEALRTRLEAALLLCEKYKKYSNAKRDSIVFNEAIEEWEERK